MWEIIEPIPSILVLGLFAAALVYNIRRMVLYGGLRGLVFGSKVERTTAELALPRKMMIRKLLHVHRLENGEVGVEITLKAPMAYSKGGFVLAPEEARILAQGLLEASQKAPPERTEAESAEVVAASWPSRACK